MTTKPELQTEGSFVAGLAAVALFIVLGAVFMGVSFPAPAGFGEGAAITKSLGAAMFDIAPSAIMGEGETAVPGEGFLVTFEIIDIVLVAALVGSVMLARREVAGESVTLGVETTDDDDMAVAADGGPGGDDS
ncbi:proton-conducting membrane transporter [Haloarcula sp. S1AR25-5A]|uniref:Proton-conducting membrane transporter n=1 Tax=Haloarcula terrestris TaxID=2950533 RepID=A0AAE4JIF4_9EURY|nr:proton-conducting membrane transporter [Haloarcula terrestris]MDS0221046.1 proton-conducting membrane transporter [Haloarcula terrestris]